MPDLPDISYKVLDQLPDAVFWFDKEGDFFEVNTTAINAWGYTREELLKLSIFDLNPNMSRGIWKQHWETKQKDSSTFESTHRRKNGEIFPVDISDNFVEHEGKVYSCAIIRDISKRKIADRVARLSDFTVQKASDAIFWLCPKGFIKHVNDEACERYGYTKQELEKMNILEISKTTEPDAYSAIWQAIKGSGKYTFEGEHYKKEGKRLPVEISGHYIEFEGMEYACVLARDITQRKMKEGAIRGALMEIRELKEKLEAENNYLQEEMKGQNNFGDIISISQSFKKVLKQIEQVAGTDSTVLITGESGTGKELLASAVHQLSVRNQRPMIKINCATLPHNLIESELFGHEKGAFTGALNMKLGKFELADQGTLFLDEIGEMPIELQSKLLRALQEGEIERVGGQGVIKVNVRIIAATNRKLEKEIEAGRFREDLFYRLNVFPIHSIPLRERKEDVPVLIRFFSEKIGNRLGRKITNIPQKVIDSLMSYDFPGNIRELENIVERAIITSRSGKLNLGDWFAPKKKIRKARNFMTLEAIQKQHIQDVLKHTQWRVSGESGAAKILNMRPTTLYSKMEKLGIKRSLEVKE